MGNLRKQLWIALALMSLSSALVLRLATASSAPEELNRAVSLLR